MTDTPVEVTQVDRDAAAELVHEIAGLNWLPACHVAVTAFARHRTAAQPRTDDATVERAWNALKDECCADPAKANRCVMVSKEAFAKALSALPVQHDTLMDEVVEVLKEADDQLAECHGHLFQQWKRPEPAPIRKAIYTIRSTLNRIREVRG